MDVSAGGPVVVVRPSGELDIAAAAELRNALLQACTSTTERVIIDCTEVTFIDSTALGVMAAAAKRLKASGYQLSMTNLSATAKRAVSLAGLTEFLGVQGEMS